MKYTYHYPQELAEFYKAIAGEPVTCLFLVSDFDTTVGPNFTLKWDGYRKSRKWTMIVDEGGLGDFQTVEECFIAYDWYVVGKDLRNVL